MKRRILLIISILAGILVLSALVALAGNSGVTTVNEVKFETTGKRLTERGAICIHSNDQFTAANGVTSGSGTQAYPYIIENWCIDASTAPPGVWAGIDIKHTNAWFIIRNCVIHDGLKANNRGIYLECGNGKIENCTIYNNSRGIELYSASNNIIDSNQIYSNSWGLYLIFSSGNGITSNHIYNNSEYGIFVWVSSENLLRSNVLENNAYNFGVDGKEIAHFYQDIDNSNTIDTKPIYYLVEQSGLLLDGIDVGYLALISCSNITVRNLNLTNNIVGSSLVNTSYSVITSNYIYNNPQFGINLLSSSNNDITSNEIHNSMCGVELKDSPSNNITLNRIYNSSYGIDLDYHSSNNILISNRIYNSYWSGILLRFSSNNNIITSNWIYNTYCVGINVICLSGSNIITSNQIYNNSEGISLSKSSNNEICYNNIYNNSNGISFSKSSNNEIYYNNIYNNTHWGSYNYNSESEYIANTVYSWWGSASGPYHPSANPSGRGDNISSNVLYDPWLIKSINFTPPRVVSTNPVSNAVDVLVDTTIIITFSKSMNTSTLSRNITIEPEIQIQDYTWNDENKTLVLTLASSLSSYTWYKVTINTNVKDSDTVLDSNGVKHSVEKNLESTYIFSFRTKDITPPVANARLDKEVDEDVEVELNAFLSWDNVGIVNWTWSLVDKGEEVFLYGEIVYYTFTQPGYYVITLNVSDASNNWAVDIVNITVKDVTLPEIISIQANPAVQAQGGYVNITCVANDNVGVSVVNVIITGPVGFAPANATMKKIPGTNNYYHSSSYWVAGEYSFYIRAKDFFDNEKKSVVYHFTVTIAVTLLIGGTQIDVMGVGNGTVNVGSILLSQPPPENLHYIGIQVSVTITGELTYANITIKYSESDVANIDETKLRMYYWDVQENKWKLCDDTGVDTNKNIVWANVTHLTIFAPMAEKGPAPPTNLFLYGTIAVIVAIVALVGAGISVKCRKKVRRPEAKLEKTAPKAELPFPKPMTKVEVPIHEIPPPTLPVFCPQCKTTFQVKPRKRPFKVKCPKCGMKGMIK